MFIFAEVSPAEPSVRSSIESLGRLFTIVLALAIGEAFKQFLSDKAVEPKDRHIHWDRIWALIAFVMLVVPFSLRMARHFFDTYLASVPPRPYSAFLIFDSCFFTLEAVLFFVLSRSLPLVQWQRFYITVVILLLLDAIWDLITTFYYVPTTWCWGIINDITAVLLIAILVTWRKSNSPIGVAIATFVVIARTVADYWIDFSYYFPPQP
jgi:hypothetical protein